MADIIFLVLLALHIGSIIGWMGGATLFISVVSPSLRKMTPPTRAEFIISTLPAYLRFIIGTSISGVVAGILLFGYITSVQPSFSPSSSGTVLIQVGAVLGLIVLLMVFGVFLPTSRKLVSLAKQMKQAPTSPSTEGNQITILQKRLTAAGGIGTALLALTLVLMIIGTNI